ncbi:hypothetical protein [Mycetocola reblochoni]|uniref:ATP synthase protein I2 n=2 Tax=Mycetocola reblochoni TaxID=331618 RepID=A0A1R4JTF8_9MICO|nr:hypothetical protein [Mycetocola reblochoni]RLP70388.1 hypothetical protein D9V30_02445 [Mycetocola reblochoni]SJN35380.1 ATP synthase protein I2 [Mycetocola reblochoni REB411]
MSSTPVFRTIVRAGLLLALAIAVVGGVVGWLVVGSTGLVGALLGAVVAAVLVTMTAASILFANRFQDTPGYVTTFFAIVLGGWVLKFVIFIVLVLTLSGQPWLDRTVFLLCIIAGVLVSLILDVVIVSRARIGNVSDVELPGQTTGRDEGNSIS